MKVFSQADLDFWDENGYVILDANLAEVDEYMGGRPHPGRNRTSGHFGFAGHSDPVQFRNVAIKRL